MKLTDLDTTNAPVKALKENFNIRLDLPAMNNMQTRTMLGKVRGLINEAKRTPSFHQTQNSASYLKLVFMEQALSAHLGNLKRPSIVLENEEVEKSQVILAAQDMIDTVQKMYEDINDMLVKELPALVDSIQSEIGANESESFNQVATDALTALNSALQEAQSSLKNGLGTLTGQETASFAGDEDMSTDMDMDSELDTDMDMDSELDTDMDMDSDLDADETSLPELPEPDEMPSAGAGREKR